MKRVDVDWMAFFLWALSENPNLSRACEVANVSRMTAYRFRKTNPEFAAAWDDALAQSTDALVGEAFRRAKEGVLKPVFQGGKQVGAVREYSDVLTIFLLKCHRPEVYRETLNQNLQHAGGVKIQVEWDDVDNQASSAPPGTEDHPEGGQAI